MNSGSSPCAPRYLDEDSEPKFSTFCAPAVAQGEQSRLLLLQKEQEAAQKKELAGNITASWGDQMRNYVLNPYQMVKDLRTEHEVGNPQAVFNGEIDDFIEAGIRWRRQQEAPAA